MNGADGEPRLQLPTTAARENDYSAIEVTSVQCRRWQPSRNRIFCRSVTFVGYQFLTDFDVYALGDLLAIIMCIFPLFSLEAQAIAPRSQSNKPGAVVGGELHQVQSINR